MDAQIKAQWVAALRSGEYQQGKHVLHNVDENTFCCLGVLCDLAVKAGILGAGSHEYNNTADGDIEVYGAEGDRHSAGGVTLPEEVRAWTGLVDDNPEVFDDESDEDHDLATLNDEGATFEYLAELIERDL